MILFQNFELSEFLASNTAKEQGIDNTPTFAVVCNLIELVSCILQPARSAWGSGIIVKSGYRCPELNKAVDGSETSVHKIGYAADLFPSNGKFDEFVAFFAHFLVSNNIAFDQMIIEKQGQSRWLHVSLYNNSHQQRRQIKSITK